jgi:hypothetical protein
MVGVGMSRLQLAQQGYAALAGAIAVSLNEATSDRAEEWLRNEVCPVVPELARNRSFRLAVRWSGDHLSRGANADERRLVEAVDEALVRCAMELAAVTVADARETSVDHQDAPFRVAINPSERAKIDLIAGRPWLDLVCCEDFFHPACELCLRNPNSDHTIAFRSRGELRLPLGDYIARYMFGRIDYWKSLLEPIWNDVFFRPVRPDNGRQVAGNRLFDAKINLDSAIQRLRNACCSGPRPQQREACVALTQIYAAYAQAPKLEWVGLRHGVSTGIGGVIRSCVRRRNSEMITVQPGRHGSLEVVDRQPASLCDPVILRQVSAALHDVAPFYELPEDPDDLIEWAIDRARLVIVDRSPRAVFWDGAEIAAGEWDQHPREWNLLWVLGSNPGQPVDQMMLMNPEHHPIKSRRHRLSQILNNVLDLDGHIDTVRGQGYQLQLTAENVILLRDAGQGRLVFESRHGTTV